MKYNSNRQRILAIPINLCYVAWILTVGAEIDIDGQFIALINAKASVAPTYSFDLPTIAITVNYGSSSATTAGPSTATASSISSTATPFAVPAAVSINAEVDVILYCSAYLNMNVLSGTISAQLGVKAAAALQVLAGGGVDSTAGPYLHLDTYLVFALEAFIRGPIFGIGGNLKNELYSTMIPILSLNYNIPPSAVNSSVIAATGTALIDFSPQLQSFLYPTKTAPAITRTIVPTVAPGHKHDRGASGSYDVVTIEVPSTCIKESKIPYLEIKHEIRNKAKT
ncbi:hypothetical protein BC830DRAFT_1173836 [Chytriomyces sp. MP71]|nr:hypothetical protein BC830DRAFT_1173836 [Chytriomyces sp. MP71]